MAVVRDWADRKAHLGAEDKYGETPIALAALAGHQDVVADLAVRGANLSPDLGAEEAWCVMALSAGQW